MLIILKIHHSLCQQKQFMRQHNAWGLIMMALDLAAVWKQIIRSAHTGEQHNLLFGWIRPIHAFHLWVRGYQAINFRWTKHNPPPLSFDSWIWWMNPFFIAVVSLALMCSNLPIYPCCCEDESQFTGIILHFSEFFLSWDYFTAFVYGLILVHAMGR